MKIAFINLPWWINTPKGLLGGIRAGSRWPFTMPAAYPPDQFVFGSYKPYPFFLGSAAAYVAREMPEAKVVMRDSIARGEGYPTFLRAMNALKPDAVVLETGAASWEHDRQWLKMLKQTNPALRVAVAGPTAREASKTGDFDAYLLGEYEKNSLKFAQGASGLLDFAMLTKEELNALPFPMFDEPCAMNYWDACPKGQIAPHLQLFTSRGCVYKCLSGETPVNTVEGMIPIRELAGRDGVGVYTYDPVQQRAKICTATNVQRYGTQDRLVRVHFDDGTHIDCTPDHRFLAFGECEAADLKPGTHLRALVNRRVVSVEELAGLHETFCLTVPETGWFYANNVLVSNCCFCAWPGTMTGDDPDGTKLRAIRFHSPGWVEGFIRDFLRRHPETRSIYLDDDTFNLADKHTLAISEVMKRIGLPWSAMCRADTSKPETWRAMKDAGCFGVKLGFESGSQRVVDEIVNKRLNLAEARETAIWLRKEVGMTVHGTFTVGLPGETDAEKQQTLDFITQLYKDGGLDTHQLSGTATIEGTPLDRISHGEALKAYPGAKAGESFVREHDGVKKLAEVQ